MKQPKEQEKLRALIRDLERELSEGKSQAAALEETHDRLRETERICQELADENRRLGGEIAAWQERLSASEEHQRQANRLRQELEALPAEPARVADRKRQTGETLADPNGVGRVASMVEAAGAEAKILETKVDPIPRVAQELTGSVEAGGCPVATDDHQAKEAKKSAINWSCFARNWRLGAAFAGVILLAIAGLVTVKMLGSDAPASREVISNSEAATVEPVAEPISRSTSKATRVRGAFQTVRATQVFSEPSRDSEPIVSIAKGTKVNVVDARDGWLEIRSKHGRPPGFIRQETAVRTGSN